MNELGLPTGKLYLKEFIERTILPSRKKQSSAVFYIPGTGRRSILRYITAFRPKVEKETEVNLGGLVWLPVDYDDEKLERGTWLRTLKEELRPEEIKDFDKDESLREILEKLTEKFRVILWVTVFDENLNIRRLEFLRQINPLKIDFQFSFPIEIEITEIKNYLGILSQFALQNIWHMPLYKDEDVRAVIKNQAEQGYVRVGDGQIKRIVELSGGYPGLVRYFLRNLDKLSADSWKETEVKHFFNEIWDGLTEKSQDWLFGMDGTPGDFLIKTGLARQGQVLFSPLFKEYVESLKEENKLNVESMDVDKLLSLQEQKVFKALEQNKNKVISRDEVARAMWGLNWEKHYSDWAIDQIIKRIRVKLGDRSKNGLIKTLRGRGFTVDE